MTAPATSSYVRPRGGLGDLPARLRTEDCTIAYPVEEARPRLKLAGLMVRS